MPQVKVYPKFTSALNRVWVLWELETGRQSEKEYRYHNGDWLIIIRLADTDDGNKRVLIFNKVEKANWTGYVNADGEVVDTHYAR